MYTDMWDVCKSFKVGSEFVYNNLKYKVTSTGIEEINKYDFLPSDIKSIILDKDTVIVNLKHSGKGVSKCSNNDEFDNFIGFIIAYYKAKNSKSFKLKQVLDLCVQSVNERGYDKAILKNY